jgi:hypothetical protein
MNSTEIIQRAIARGEEQGLHALSTHEQFVFAVSEAEMYCDKDGIDALIHRYGKEGMLLFSKTFGAVGANEIAAELQAIAKTAGIPGETLLSSVNRRITTREGHSYEELQSFAARGA